MAEFGAQAELLPMWVQIWMNVIVVGTLLSILILFFSRETRKDAIISLVLTVCGFAGVMVLYSQMGMVRLLGLGHIIPWTPWLIYLVQRLRKNPPAGLFRWAMIILSLIVTVTLFFDYLDVIRWLLGERGSIV